MNTVFPQKPTDYFDQETWRNLTGLACNVASKASAYAHDAGLSVKTDSRWPVIYFKKRRFLKVTVVAFGLQPHYLEDKNASWQVSFQTVWNLWIFTSHITGGLLDEFTAEQVRKSHDEVFERIRKCVDTKLLREDR